MKKEIHLGGFGVGEGVDGRVALAVVEEVGVAVVGG